MHTTDTTTAPVDFSQLDHIEQFEHRLSASAGLRKVACEQPYSEADEAEMLHTTDPAEMVREVERRIAFLHKQLTSTTGTFDQKTGKPHALIAEGSPQRRALEVEWHNLTKHTLPATKERAADIAARKAAMPTTADRLQAAAERQQRIQQAALKRAEELEIEEAAQRIRSQRHGAR